MPPKKSESSDSQSETEFSKFSNEMRSLFHTFEQKIITKLRKIDDKFASIFNELKDDLNAVKEEMSEIRTDVQNIKTQVDSFEESLNYHEEKVNDLEKKQEEKRAQMEKEMTEKLDGMKKNLMMQEKHDRKYNLIFHGVTEEKGEKLYDKMRNFFIRYLKVEEERVQKIVFSNGHRLPSYSERARPVIMRFTAYEDRELILSKAYNLAGTDKRVLTDLPVPMKIERQRIAKAAYGIRQKERLQTRIKDKGLEVVLEVRKDNTDRWVKRKV